ncbi:hypothetical protein ASPCAL00742 [Aspergillus calidoustus]|uniref:DUF7587 domain-containing protein n=1 Tax=Aspergillus calidoustus TaxID=454130 RepID=A0A0U5FVN2_ASPCI|nr:hypothetical protein ASPCAL00742 [Aspergillus calidoustus]
MSWSLLLFNSDPSACFGDKETSSLPTGVPAMATQILFCPNPFQRNQLKYFSRKTIPTYLFRLVAPRTAGRTSMSTVTSKATMDPECSNHPDDIFRHSQIDGAALVYAHLYWRCDERCNFMSWTSSLLFALHYGLYRHKTDRDGPDLSEIFLYILDTSDFPDGTFVKDLDILEAFKGESQDVRKLLGMRRGDNGQPRFYFGEYLTQGRLEIEGRCARVSLQQLIDLGLFELHPGLENQKGWALLVRRVLELRTNFANLPATTCSEVRKAITIAQCCVGDRWAVPFSAMLLALRPRSRDDHAKIEAAYSAMFAADEILVQDIQIDPEGLPEVKRFGELINAINHKFNNSDINILLNPFLRLAFE